MRVRQAGSDESVGRSRLLLLILDVASRRKFWLTLCLLVELQRIGVPLNDTLIEQQVGGDEVDCLAVVSGELVFFELKDKDFNLGNAYSFGAKMGILRPDHAVILSTQKIGGGCTRTLRTSAFSA